MEKDILDGSLGNKGAYDLEFKGGKLVAKLGYSPLGGVSGSVLVEVEASVVLDALAKAIPGTFDDAIIEGAKKLLAQ